MSQRTILDQDRRLSGSAEESSHISTVRASAPKREVTLARGSPSQSYAGIGPSARVLRKSAEGAKKVLPVVAVEKSRSRS